MRSASDKGGVDGTKSLQKATRAMKVPVEFASTTKVQSPTTNKYGAEHLVLSVSSACSSGQNTSLSANRTLSLSSILSASATAHTQLLSTVLLTAKLQSPNFS